MIILLQKLNADFVFIYGYSDDKKLLKLKKLQNIKISQLYDYMLL